MKNTRRSGRMRLLNALEDYPATITLFTAFVALAIAVVANILIWMQTKHGKESLRLSAESIELSRAQFASTQRPWLELEVIPNGKVMWTEERDRVGVSVDVFVTNLGSLPATNIKMGRAMLGRVPEGWTLGRPNRIVEGIDLDFEDCYVSTVFPGGRKRVATRDVFTDKLPPGQTVSFPATFIAVTYENGATGIRHRTTNSYFLSQSDSPNGNQYTVDLKVMRSISDEIKAGFRAMLSLQSTCVDDYAPERGSATEVAK